MMTKHTLLCMALAAAGCWSSTSSTPGGDPKPDTVVVAPTAKTKIALTAVTFADDCGGAAPHQAPTTPPPMTRVKSVPATPAASAAPGVAPRDIAARRRCEQTSMQLSIAGDATGELHIKSIEVFDESGAPLGKLSTHKPMRWADANAAYEPWDERVVAGQMSVSYALSQPTFVNRWEMRDRTYTVKVVAAIAGVEQSLQTAVMVVGQPPAVPT